MPDETIGSVRVGITGDYSQLVKDYSQVQAISSKAGAQIAQSFSQGANSAPNLEAAINRVTEAVTRESAALSLSIQRNMALAGARDSAAGAATRHAAASAHEVSQIQATSGAIRTLEGNGGIRAVENFLAKTLGLGPAMQAIFPIIGAIAFAEIAVKIGEKLHELYVEGQEGARRVADGFRGLNNSLQQTDDELGLTNAKLRNQIAILEGTPQNKLAEALATARIEADRLSKSLEKDIEDMQKLMEEQGVSKGASVLSLFTGNPVMPTGNTDELKKFKQKLQPLDDQIREAVGDPNAIKALIADRYRLIQNEIERHSDELRKFQALQADHDKAAANARKNPGELSTLGVYANPDYSANIAQQMGIVRNLNRLLQVDQDTQTKTALEGRKDALEGQKQANEAAKRAAQEWLHSQEETLAVRKSQEELTITQERAFWAGLLPAAEAGGAAYADVLRTVQVKVGNLTQQMFRQRHEANLHEVQEQEKDFREQLKEAMSGAALPQTAGLQFLQGQLSKDTITEGGLKVALEEIPKLTEAAARESEDVMRRWVATSQAIFEEGGVRSAAEVSKHAGEMIATLRALGGMEDEIAAQQKRKNAADKQLNSQGLRLADIGAGGAASQADAGIQAQKIAAQQAYESASFHTLQGEIDYKRQIASLDEQSMALKRNAALEEFNAATAAGDVARAEEAAVRWLREDDAIRLHRLQTEAQIATETKRNTAAHQVSAGLGQDIASAGQSLAQSFGQAVANGGKLGQVFHQSLKGLEASAISTAVGTAIKQALQSSGITAGITALTSTIVSHAGIMLTHAGVMLSHLGVMAAHLGAMLAHLGVMVANTIATIANTIAVIWNTIVQAIKGLFGFLGFAEGGRPGVGVPSIVGENGPELFIPDGAGTIVPHGKSMELLAGLDLSVPGAPAPVNLRNSGSSNFPGGTTVTNQNTGSIGSMHFNVSGAQNPREVVRQIADFMKRQSPRFSPSNLGPSSNS